MKREKNFTLSFVLHSLFVCMILIFWLGLKLCDAAWNQLGRITYFTFQLNVGVSRDNILILQLIPILSILSLIVIAICLLLISAPNKMTLRFFHVIITIFLALICMGFLISIILAILQNGFGWHWIFYFFLFIVIFGKELMIGVILPAIFFLVLWLFLRSNEKNKM